MNERRQKQIEECELVLFMTLADTMPDWQALRITNAIKGFIKAHTGPAELPAKSDHPTFQAQKVG